MHACVSYLHSLCVKRVLKHIYDMFMHVYTILRQILWQMNLLCVCKLWGLCITGNPIETIKQQRLLWRLTGASHPNKSDSIALERYNLPEAPLATHRLLYMHTLPHTQLLFTCIGHIHIVVTLHCHMHSYTFSFWVGMVLAAALPSSS